jgi:DNA-binding transcriptional ArsR family regulator
MLEQLFGSKTRVRLLRLFLQSDKDAYFVRELTRKIGSQINAVRNELDNLLKMGIVVAVTDDFELDAEGEPQARKGKSAQQRKYYRLNQDALLYPELRALFMKAQVAVEKNFVRKLTESGGVSYMALTGYFVGVEDAPTDIFVVGKIGKDRAASIIRGFEREIGRELNYTVMTPQEYKYRREVTDRFLYSILETKKIVVVDTISERIAVA